MDHFSGQVNFVSTVGSDEETIRRYAKYQEKEEKREKAQDKNFSLL
jgi:hypothetical protein